MTSQELAERDAALVAAGVSTFVARSSHNAVAFEEAPCLLDLHTGSQPIEGAAGQQAGQAVLQDGSAPAASLSEVT